MDKSMKSSEMIRNGLEFLFSYEELKKMKNSNNVFSQK